MSIEGKIRPIRRKSLHEELAESIAEMIVDGPSAPHDILRLLGVEALARYIIDEVEIGRGSCRVGMYI